MLIAIVLDKPLEEAKQLVDDPAAFTREMTRILRDTHPLIVQMMKPAESSEPPLPLRARVVPVAVETFALYHTNSSNKTHQMTQSTQVPRRAISIQLQLTRTALSPWGTHG